MRTEWLIRQVGDVIVPLLKREASGGNADPFYGVMHVQVPEPGDAVLAGAGQGAAVGAERHASDGAAAGQGLSDLRWVRRVGDIPQVDRAVVVAAGQGVAVGAERHASDGAAGAGGQGGSGL